MLHSAVLNVMIKAAHRAGRSLKRDLGEVENLQVSLKGPRNFVTAADRRAEEIVREELAKARPDYGFLGEEGGAREGADKSHRWIVDPLDGTTNFLHGIPHFAVSIALERDGAIVAGVVYNPANDELFVAERGKGAYLNDKRIRVAARQRLAEAVVACGLPHYGRAAISLWRAAKSPPRSSISPACAAMARRPSISPGSPPAGSTPIGSAICRRGISPRARSWCAKPAALSAISTAAAPSSPSAKSPPATTPCTANCCACSRRPAKEAEQQAAAP